MAALHKFKDDVAAGEHQVSADKLDTNFRAVRLRVGVSAEQVMEIIPAIGGSDAIMFRPPEGEGIFVLAWTGESAVWLETEAC